MHQQVSGSFHRVLIYIIIILSGITLGYSIGYSSNILISGLFLLTTLATLLIINHRSVFYLILFSSFFLDNILYSAGLKLSILFGIDILIFLYFVYAIFVLVIKKHHSSEIPSFVLNFFLLYVILLTISIIINRDVSPVALKAISYHSRFILLFLSVLIIEKDLRFFERIIKFIVIIGLLQIPISLLQKIVYWGGSPDYMGGTISIGGFSTNGGSVFCVMMMSIFFLQYQFSKKQKYLFISFLLFIPILLSSGRAALLFIILNLFLYIIFLDKNRLVKTRKFRNLVLLGLFAVIVYFSFTLILPYINERDVSALKLFTDKEAFYSYTFKTSKMGGINRFQIFIYFMNILKEQAVNFIFGFGPGSHTISRLLDIKGSVIGEKGVFLTGLHSLGYTILELGIVLYLVIVGFLTKVAFISKRLFFEERGLFWKIITGSYFLIAITYIYSSIYWKIWLTHGISFTVWFMTAAILKYHLVKVRRKNGKTI